MFWILCIVLVISVPTGSWVRDHEQSQRIQQCISEGYDATIDDNGNLKECKRKIDGNTDARPDWA